jgi:hypothetical protein
MGPHMATGFLLFMTAKLKYRTMDFKKTQPGQAVHVSHEVDACWGISQIDTRLLMRGILVSPAFARRRRKDTGEIRLQ